MHGGKAWWRRVTASAMLVFAFGFCPLLLAAPIKTQPVTVKVALKNGTRTIVLVGRDGPQLFYRLPSQPEGVQATMDIRTIREGEFGIKFNEESVVHAVVAHDWMTAANIILRPVRATVRYLDIPNNDALAPAIEAAGYLLRAARAAERKGDGDSLTRAQKIYAMAGALFNGAAKAHWNAVAELAELRAIMCLIAMNKLDQAKEKLEAAREPDVDDWAYGTYWLAWANLQYKQDEVQEALESAVRSVVFQDKEIATFPDALMLSAACYEEVLEPHRARDVYYEVARLFPGTEWAADATKRLAYMMDNGLTEAPEAARIVNVFFGLDEDMNKTVSAYLDQLKERKNKSLGEKE